MGIANGIQAIRNAAASPSLPPAPINPVIEHDWGGRTDTHSGKRVTPEIAKTISSAYRCGNIISDDIASMPFQQFYKQGRTILQVEPDQVLRNSAYLLGICPNRWMVPFIYKKTMQLWLMYWGNAYSWQPSGDYRELFILPANRTFPVLDKFGNRWFETYFPNGTHDLIPDNEVMHIMINSVDGITGRSVVTYAKETMGRQLGAHETQDRISGRGLNPAAAIFMKGSFKDDQNGDSARKKVKNTYLDAISDSDNSGGVAVFDDKVDKFEAITLKPTDAQFLETMQFTDLEIANFFGLPLWKLNQGKQSYESNTQQQLDYLATTLNPYLVQWEQAARLKMLRADEQMSGYFRFIRESLLQTDPKTRADYLKTLIESAQMSPNEARQVNDMSDYPEGNGHYLSGKLVSVTENGVLVAPNAAALTPEPATEGDN